MPFTVSFKDHTYQRRQALMSHFYIDEMVYGELGINISSTKHGVNSHLKRPNNKHHNLPNCVGIIKKNWSNIISPHPKDFEELYSRIFGLISVQVGIGNVALYDISLNIGINLYPKVLPEKYVYVHGDVKKSAEILLGKKIKDFRVPTSSFSASFPNISAMDLEDMLCVYREEIKLKGQKFYYRDLAKLPQRLHKKYLIEIL